MDGQAIKSCSILAAQAQDTNITTIEGLAKPNVEPNLALHPVQKAFSECHALQCGFCTPGMIMSSVDLLSKNADPTDEEIIEALEGNLCRCTGYINIVSAVRTAAQIMREEAVQ
jgi:carbon-monoxide dehydrogenase small subunit